METGCVHSTGVNDNPPSPGRNPCESLRNTLKVSNEEDLCDIPSKKRRRSSVRRKSLLEALQSLPGTPTKSVLVEQRSHLLNSSKIPEDVSQNCSSASKQMMPIEEPDDLENHNNIPDTAFVLDWYSALTFEVSEWRTLFKEYKAKAAHAKDHALAFLQEDISFESNDAMPISSCKTFETDLKNLEQRFAVATNSISASIERACDVRNTQENFVSRTMKKLATSFQPDRSNPKLILEKICSLTELLTADNISSHSIT